MKRVYYLVILALFILPVPVKAQEIMLLITSPQPTQYLQGAVEIIGTNNLPDFESSTLAFAYAQDQSTWFLIFDEIPEVEDGLLGNWDTTVLTDGDYTLRLRVRRTDGTQEEIFVEDLRIRNYTPLPTETPLPPTPTLWLPKATSIPATVTPPYPAPTPLPPNPLTVSTGEVYANLGKGALLALGLFLAVGLYLRVRR